MTGLREKVARSLMIARGGCDVTDWREAEWNPHVAQTLIEADAAIAVCMEEAAKVAESYAEQTDYDIEPEAAVAENVTARFIAAALRALRGEGGVDG